MEDNEEYAKLLSSINIAGTGLKRPLSPIQTAQYIERLYAEEGSDTAKLLLPIATKITSDFLNLLKLPEQCKDAVIWGKSQDVGVGFSAASSIPSLDEPDDQLLLFKEASNQSLDVPDIREIISFYKKNDLPLNEVIEKITSARPVISTTYLVIISMLDETKKKIEELSKNSNSSEKSIITEKLLEKFGIPSVESIIIKGKNLAISFKEEEYRIYKNYIQKLNLEYDKISEFLVK
jgi:hypothetical protein